MDYRQSLYWRWVPKRPKYEGQHYVHFMSTNEIGFANYKKGVGWDNPDVDAWAAIPPWKPTYAKPETAPQP